MMNLGMPRASESLTPLMTSPNPCVYTRWRLTHVCEVLGSCALFISRAATRTWVRVPSML